MREERNDMHYGLMHRRVQLHAHRPLGLSLELKGQAEWQMGSSRGMYSASTTGQSRAEVRESCASRARQRERARKATIGSVKPAGLLGGRPTTGSNRGQGQTRRLQGERCSKTARPTAANKTGALQRALDLALREGRSEFAPALLLVPIITFGSFTTNLPFALSLSL
jgi:hypothetical protein